MINLLATSTYNQVCIKGFDTFIMRKNVIYSIKNLVIHTNPKFVLFSYSPILRYQISVPKHNLHTGCVDILFFSFADPVETKVLYTVNNKSYTREKLCGFRLIVTTNA